jgi:3-hydroxyacyl-[acyl-carrier-protein] dehydratase
MPQKPPFRFVTSLSEIDERRVVGEHTFCSDESFYAGHFPGNPVTPGVILLEAMAQVGLVALGIFLLCVERRSHTLAAKFTAFTSAEVEFDLPVHPGERIQIVAERLVWRHDKLKSRAEVFLADGRLVSRGTLSGLFVKRGGRER